MNEEYSLCFETESVKETHCSFIGIVVFIPLLCYCTEANTCKLIYPVVIESHSDYKLLHKVLCNSMLCQSHWCLRLSLSWENYSHMHMYGKMCYLMFHSLNRFLVCLLTTQQSYQFHKKRWMLYNCRYRYSKYNHVSMYIKTQNVLYISVYWRSQDTLHIFHTMNIFRIFKQGGFIH